MSVAFFLHNSVEERVVAFSPSPAGPTESLLPFDAWDRLSEANPELAGIESDLEARLVRATGEGYIVPIDAATSWWAGCGRCGGASTAAPKPATSSTFSSADVGPSW